jgi:hypothetical protein
MCELQGPVPFGTEKIIGFPRLMVIFQTVPLSDSSVDDEAKSGALLRMFGLAQC